MSTRPRTPEHFPRMKHRAAGRAVRKSNRDVGARLAELCLAFERLAAAFAIFTTNALDGVRLKYELATRPPALPPIHTPATASAVTLDSPGDRT